MNRWPLRSTKRHLPLIQQWHPPRTQSRTRSLATTSPHHNHDPRARPLGKQLFDEYATIRDTYQTPKHPIVLAHGLLGFSELRFTNLLPPIQYWHGIKHALTSRGATVITASVPPSSSIQDRAARLRDDIAAQVTPGYTGPVNIIAHSMGGLDARYMTKEFNPSVPDDPNVRYFSYGASVDKLPLLSPFYLSRGIVAEKEGPNDGLVSVDSSRWGIYEGTLQATSHLDLINWPNRVRWTVRGLMGMKKPFNAVAFYLDVADMLAKEGL